jgi:hypothetical protein
VSFFFFFSFSVCDQIISTFKQIPHVIYGTIASSTERKESENNKKQTHPLQQTTQYTIDINDGDDDKAHTALNRAFTSFPISEKARKKGRVG